MSFNRNNDFRRIQRWINSLKEPFDCDESKLIFVSDKPWSITTIDVDVSGKNRLAKAKSSQELEDDPMQIDDVADDETIEYGDREKNKYDEESKYEENGSNAKRKKTAENEIIDITSDSEENDQLIELAKETIIEDIGSHVAVNGTKRRNDTTSSSENELMDECEQREERETEPKSKVNIANKTNAHFVVDGNHHQVIDSNMTVFSIDSTTTDKQILLEKICISDDSKSNTSNYHKFDGDQTQRMDDGCVENFIKCTHCDMAFDTLELKWQHECLTHKPQVVCHRISTTANPISTIVQLNSCAGPGYHLRKRK